MSGSGLFDFLITIVGLIIVGGMIFAGLEFISTDERFKKIGRFAVGGVLVLVFLYAIKGVLFGGGGAAVITPIALIYFAIGVIVLLVVLYIVMLALDYMVKWVPLLGGFMDAIKFVIGAVAIIVMLLLAANLLFGASLGGYQTPFQSKRSQLEGPVFARIAPAQSSTGVQYDRAGATVYL